MKKIFTLAIFATMSLCSNAQFKLTPSSGLMTEEGPYTIMKAGSEAENYEAARRAVEFAIPGADIGDLEYEKSFAVSVVYNAHEKLPGALQATDWSIDYHLKVEAFDGKIEISFTEAGTWVVRRKGEVIQNIYPTTGKNSFSRAVFGHNFLFNSKGKICKGGKKVVAKYEEIANGIVRDIENNL